MASFSIVDDGLQKSTNSKMQRETSISETVRDNVNEEDDERRARERTPCVVRQQRCPHVQRQTGRVDWLVIRIGNVPPVYACVGFA
jgi:hypothetical protein